jgi:hypothetical protein
VAVQPTGLADLLDEQEVGRLLVDAGSPEGYAIDRSGTRSPLPVTDLHGSTSGREDPDDGAGA